MIRVQLGLSPKQLEILKKLQEAWGLSFAETVRRVIDASPDMKEELKRIEVGKRILKGNE